MKLTRLFDQPIKTKQNVITAAAIKELESLPRGTFLNPMLAGRVADIIRRHKLAIAELTHGGVTKTRTHSANHRLPSRLNVTFKFTGDIGSLMLRPSVSKPIEKEFDFNHDSQSIVCSIDDNESIDDTIDAIVDALNENLAKLREEWNTFPQTLETEIKAIADKLAQRIADEEKRDSNSKYPTAVR